MNHLILVLLLVLSSCAVGKKRAFRKTDYELGTSAKINVAYIRQIKNKLEFNLLGLSTGADIVAIRKDEISCGAGKEPFEDVNVKYGKDDLIIFPKISFVEFTIICKNDELVDKKLVPYLIFDKIYSINGEELGPVISTKHRMDIK